VRFVSGKVYVMPLLAKKNRTASLLLFDISQSALVMNWFSVNGQASLNAEEPCASNGREVLIVCGVGIK